MGNLAYAHKISLQQTLGINCVFKDTMAEILWGKISCVGDA